MPVGSWHGPIVALHAPDRRAVEQEHAEIDEVAEMVPQDVVGPAALIAGGADIDQALDEEPTGDVADFLLAGAGPGEQRLALAAEAHGVAEAVDLAALLAGGDDPLGARQAQRDRDLDQRVLAGLQALDRLLLVLVARAWR